MSIAKAVDIVHFKEELRAAFKSSVSENCIGFITETQEITGTRENHNSSFMIIVQHKRFNSLLVLMFIWFQRHGHRL